MNKQPTTNQQATILSTHELLAHWQGHRRLTRRVLEVFPEKELFEFSIGGMRPFAALIKEMLAIAVPGLQSMATGEEVPFQEENQQLSTKQALLDAWDKATEGIETYWPQLSPERFYETFNLFGQYNYPILHNILYFIDNEIHHRGQGYVYLRALGITPPPFWER